MSLLHQFLVKTASRHPERCTLLEGERVTTYQELATGADRVAAGLAQLGVGRGDRVALLAHNSRFYVESLFGILAAGAVAVPLNTAASPKSVRFFLGDSGARLMLVGRGCERLVHKLLADLGPVRDLVLEGPARLEPAAARLHRASELDGQMPRVELQEDDVASIVYTSGSTGTPRGATLSHRNLVANAHAILAYLSLTKEDRMLEVLPFYYIYGTSVLTTHIAVGASLVLENRFMYPQAAVDTMESQGCTGFAGVPSSFAILLNRTTFAERCPESLRYVTQAGGAMSPALTRRLMTAVAPRRVYVMYGATEAAGRLSYVPPEALADNIGSIGQPIDGVSFSLRTDAGDEAGPGEVGEIVAQGDCIMRGYWNDAAETEAALGPSGYRTGDLARINANGFYEIVGRKKDMIKSGAHRISAKEIEEEILEHDNVHEVAVVGAPDELLGEAIWAFVVPREASLSSAQVRAFLGPRLPAFKQPGVVEICADLPKNASGKIMKEPLRKRAREATGESE
jgi:acyl-CoA synthetase (AMP-forming)/AMP-acid ligase II